MADKTPSRLVLMPRFVVAAEKKVVSKLLQPVKTSEKVYKIDDHMVAAVAGALSLPFLPNLAAA